MKWKLILHPPGTGKFNMDYDISLARNCGDEDAFFRIYTWKPYCISLGANQSYEDINLEKAAYDKIDTVKRPTGGRAILHAEEITYSVVIPVAAGYSPKSLYEKISKALVRGLGMYDPYLSKLILENEQPHFPSLLKEPSGKLCFASTAKNEIKFDAKKVVGSAQRKFNKVLLQHGSILCGKFHRKIVNYINENKAGLNLEESTIELESILNRPVNYNRLKSALVEGMQQEWKINFTMEPEPQINSLSVAEEIL
jgi:lipoate-protein ligase A